MMARCLDGLLLFADDDDRTVFLRLLAQYVNETGCRCYSWALMPDHYYLLPRNGDRELWRIMKPLIRFGISMDSLLQRRRIVGITDARSVFR